MASVHNLHHQSQVHAAEMALSAALRLGRVQSSTGSYLYEYDSIKDVPNNSNYSMIRMAGAAYGMCSAAEFFSGTRAGEVISSSAHKAIDFLLRTCRFAEPAYFVCDFSFESGMRKYGNTGATALLVNALLFMPFRVEFEDELKRLIHTLLLSQTSSGAIRALLHSSDSLGSQRYAPGEALLALARYGIIFDDQEILMRVRSSLSFYENYFSVDAHIGMVLWHVDCWSRMACAAHATNDHEFCRHSLKFCRQLLSRLAPTMQRWSLFRLERDPDKTTLKIGASTALFVEALSRYIQCSHLIEGQEEDLAILKAHLADGMNCLGRLQVGAQLDGRRVNETLALGACRSNLESGHLRMDNDQHFITACLATIENPHLFERKVLDEEFIA